MVRVILKKRKVGHNILPLPLPQMEFKTKLKNKIKTNFTFKWENLEGAGGEGCGRGDRDGEHMQTHGCFISVYDKIHYK